MDTKVSIDRAESSNNRLPAVESPPVPAGPAEVPAETTDFSVACFAVYTKKPAIPAGFLVRALLIFCGFWGLFFVFPGDG